MRRKITRLAAAAVLATGLAVSPVSTPAALADHGEPGPGWNLIHVYPTKSECVQAGIAGKWSVDPVNGQWDDFRCEQHIEPLRTTTAGATGGTTQWALWVVIWV